MVRAIPWVWAGLLMASACGGDSATAEADVSALRQQLTTLEQTVSALEPSSESSDWQDAIDALEQELDGALEEHGASFDDLASELESLALAVDELDARLMEFMASSGAGSGYTDEMAVQAVQNLDPWSDPTAANLTDLWSQTERGFHHLTESRWTMDNRTDPAGRPPRHELVQMFHETPECGEGATFDSCNSAGALKMYINGPRITDHDWSEEGFRAAARRAYHTHASGLYLVSFGTGSTVSDREYGLIPPSGIHLEPHGFHQALRIDGTNNTGENVRIDTTLGSKGIAIYQSPLPSPLCDELGSECTRTHPLYIRGGRIHLEDVEIERSAMDARGMGAASLHTHTVGVEPFYSWHIDDGIGEGVPVHCAWNTRTSAESLVKLTPYSTSPDLAVSHTYTLVEVWGPGGAPDNCRAVQSIKTDAAGVYGFAFPDSMLEQGGFSVALLGPSASAPLDPGAWGESERPSVMFELIEPL